MRTVYMVAGNFPTRELNTRMDCSKMKKNTHTQTHTQQKHTHTHTHTSIYVYWCVL